MGIIRPTSLGSTRIIETAKPFPHGSVVKRPPANAGDLCSIPGSKRSPVFLPGEFHGQRSLEGYSPWGHKEFDTTEQLNNNNKALNAMPGVWKGLSGW